MSGFMFNCTNSYGALPTGAYSGRKMKFDYEIDQRIPLARSVLFGIQWAALLVPSIIILGIVACSVHSFDAVDQINYLQKLFFVSGVVLLCQIFWGHRLPLVPGPSAILLIGVVAGQAAGVDAIYTSVITGGLFISLLSVFGLFKYLQRLFTVNVISTVLLLIAFTLAPTIMELILGGRNSPNPSSNISFATGLILAMFFSYGFMKGIWRATLIIWAVLAGAISYYVIFPSALKGLPSLENYSLGGFFHISSGLSFQPGLILSFIICFLGLSINDLGSMQAVNELLETKDPDKRISRGVFVTGLSNIFSGILGVIGPVNYSMSPGVIMSSGCASRFSLIPAACISLLLAFMPLVVGIVINAPSTVIGALMTYLMGTQVASGLVLAVKDRPGGLKYEDALVIGASTLLGVIAVFLPDQVLKAIHPSLKPLLGNGLVVGVISAVILEHVVIKKR
jgi:xanthine/uracil permease